MDLFQLLSDTPTGEPMDFESFAAAMTAVPIEELDQYLNEADEDFGEDEDENPKDAPAHDQGTKDEDVPMTDEHFDFSDTDNDSKSSEDDSMIDEEDSGSDYQQQPELFDDDEEILTPDDPEFKAVLEQTERVLSRISFRGQNVIDQIPLSTQIILANQANEEVFKPYAKHGSAAQFSASVMKFLAGGDTVRRPGKDGSDKRKDGKLRLRVSEIRHNTGGEGDGHPDDHDRDGRGRTPEVSDDMLDMDLKVSKRGQGQVKTEWYSQDGQNKASFVEDSDAAIDHLSHRKTSDPFNQVNNTRNFSGSSGYQTTATRSLSGSSMADPFSSKESSRKSSLTDPSIHEGYTPLAAGFSNIGLNTPAYPHLGIPPSTEPHLPPFNAQALVTNHSCVIDLAENQRLRYEPYEPISMHFIWPATLRSSGEQSNPTPGLIDCLNEILFICNAEAKGMLRYYVNKYERLMPADTSGRYRQEPPHALFRLGIAQYIMSKYGKMIEHKERDELGLTPEARNLLNGVWEAHPSMQTHFEDTTLDDIAGLEQKVQHEIDEDGDLDEYYYDEDEDELRESVEEMFRQDSHYGVGGPVRAKPRPKVVGGLNILEKTLLARACNIDIDTVDAYWDNMRESTTAWAAMKAWCNARSAERVAAAKQNGSW